MNKNILFICGSKNQTTMLHKVSQKLPGYNHYFTPYYADGIERLATKLGLLEFTVLGKKFCDQAFSYFRENDLNIDYRGEGRDYSLVVLCSDLIVPGNIKGIPTLLLQEGMTDPENLAFEFVKRLGIPGYFGGTAATGLSDCFDTFCVASEGYKDLFVSKGVNPEKIKVTGLPNFDNCASYLNNDFPYSGYALVCSSDARETYKPENRKKFIKRAIELSEGKQLIFKLHPNENYPRAAREINKYAPGSLIFHKGNTDVMIANCDILITHYSTVVYVGIALGKKVYSSFNIDELRRLAPIQNNGISAESIAFECRRLLGDFATVPAEQKSPPLEVAVITA